MTHLERSPGHDDLMAERGVGPYYADDWLRVYQGDCREVMASMEAGSVHCVVTSPPYFGLRDYGDAGQIGLEETVDQYVATMVAVFGEVRRVLRDDGTLWLNLGDSYAGSWGAQSRRVTDSDDKSWHGSQIKNHPKRAANTGSLRTAGVKPKDLYGVPWRVAFALQADGWYLRSDIIWSKPNPMPESVTDRPTKSHEYLFLLSKRPTYYFDADAVREGWSDDRQGAPGGKRPAERNRGGRTDGYTSPPGSWTSPAARQWCARYFGSDGTLCSTHSGQFASPTESKCDIAGAAGRNIRSVWTVATQPYPGAHFATFPEKLIEPCIKAGSPELGTILDPFAGSGTTGRVAQRLGRRAVLIDLNADYLVQAMRRNQDIPLGLETA